VSHSTDKTREPTHRDLVEGKGHRVKDPREGKMSGVPKPGRISTKQARIAELSSQILGEGLHSLSHYIDQEWLYEAYSRTRRDGAAGVDGQTAEGYASTSVQRWRHLNQGQCDGLHEVLEALMDRQPQVELGVASCRRERVRQNGAL